MAEAEPKIRIETREELIYLLAEAAAVEHSLMCSYLYAAWSLKRRESDGLTAEQVAAVRRWKAIITSVAIEEMTHLTLANNLLISIGAGPHLSRPNFPVPPTYFPTGVVVELACFSPAVLDHFIFLERPEGRELKDAAEFVHPLDYHRTQPKGRLMPSAQDYTTQGHLYRGVRHGLEVLAHHIGEKELFCGDTDSQVGPAEASLPGLSIVRDLASAEAAIQTIIEQGEGAPAHSENSHYNRFLSVRRDYDAFAAADPSFAPAFPVAHNPVMRRPLDPHNRVYIDAHEAAQVLDFANSLYGHMLRCLVQAFGRGDDEVGKRHFVNTAIDLMELLSSVANHLASLPASHHHPGVNAGITFTMLRDIARIPRGPSEMRMMAERVAEMVRHARHIFPAGHELTGVVDELNRIVANFGISDLKTTVGGHHPLPKAKTAPPPPAEKQADLPSGAGGECEIAPGKTLDIRFDGKRCIHARFCVLGAPMVFRPNTPGTWIYPDAMPTDEVVQIAHDCPSGAIQYRRKDGGAQEHAPPVNLVNLRENGPYAFRAAMKLEGRDDIGFRATLCRCGASKMKPFCDGSHKTLPFKATGEPETRESQPLAVRDGLLVIGPEKNGPLVVTGNLEICSGTGRTIDRVTKARLCRCGGSRTKPFCDNTHLKIGFQADGN
ncbi:MAG: ferritin-like domain-containing protein [Bauldia sp.]